MSVKQERDGDSHIWDTWRHSQNRWHIVSLCSAQKVHRLSLVRCILYNIHFVPNIRCKTRYCNQDSFVSSSWNALLFTFLHHLLSLWKISHFPISFPNLVFQQILIAVHYQYFYSLFIHILLVFLHIYWYTQMTQTQLSTTLHTSYVEILYTAFNSPSLIFSLLRSETDLPSLEFAHSPVFLHNPLYIIKLAQFKIRPQVRGRKGRK